MYALVPTAHRIINRQTRVGGRGAAVKIVGYMFDDCWRFFLFGRKVAEFVRCSAVGFWRTVGAFWRLWVFCWLPELLLAPLGSPWLPTERALYLLVLPLPLP